MTLPEKNQSTRALLLQAQQGDMEAREELVKQNLALVKYIVKRFLDRGHEYEDLYQYGCIGLVKAIDRFDTGYDVAFSTYAVPVIMGEIRRYLRDDGPVHVARSIHDNAVRIQRHRDQVMRETGEEPSLEDIASALQMNREDVVLALNSVRRPRSLSEPVGQGSDMLLMDALGKDVIPAVDMRLTLAKLLRDLDETERSLIVKRYFSSRTQTEIAREMGLSQVQVSRMESKILKKLRAMAGG